MIFLFIYFLFHRNFKKAALVLIQNKNATLNIKISCVTKVKSCTLLYSEAPCAPSQVQPHMQDQEVKDLRLAAVHLWIALRTVS